MRLPRALALYIAPLTLADALGVFKPRPRRRQAPPASFGADLGGSGAGKACTCACGGNAVPTLDALADTYFESNGECADLCGIPVGSQVSAPKSTKKARCEQSCRNSASCKAYQFSWEGLCTLHYSTLVAAGNGLKSSRCYRKSTSHPASYPCPSTSPQPGDCDCPCNGTSTTAVVTTSIATTVTAAPASTTATTATSSTTTFTSFTTAIPSTSTTTVLVPTFTVATVTTTTVTTTTVASTSTIPPVVPTSTAATTTTVPTTTSPAATTTSATGTTTTGSTTSATGTTTTTVQEPSPSTTPPGTQTSATTPCSSTTSTTAGGDTPGSSATGTSTTLPPTTTTLEAGGTTQSTPRTPEALALEHFGLLNQLRAAGYTCPEGQAYAPNTLALEFDCRLWRACRLHAEDMAINRYFSHTSLDGRSPWDRAAEEGITANAENIAAGQFSAQSSLTAFQGSDGHCRGMMNAGRRWVGIGYFYDSTAPYRYYWCQLFRDATDNGPDHSCLGHSGSPITTTFGATTMTTTLYLSVPAEVKAFVVLMNNARTSGYTCGNTTRPAIAAVELECRLFRANQLHSEDMASNNYFSYTGLDGSSTWERATTQGTYATYAFMSAGRSTAADLFSSFLGSEARCELMMDSATTRIGLGFAFNADANYQYYSSLNFNTDTAPRDASCETTRMALASQSKVVRANIAEDPNLTIVGMPAFAPGTSAS